MNKDNEDSKSKFGMPKAARFVLIGGLLLALLTAVLYSSMDEFSVYEGNLDESDNYGFEAITIHGNYAYIAMGYDGLQVIDISDSTNPTFVGHYNSTTVEEITIHGNYIYIVGNTGSPDYEDIMGVLDLSDPTNPTLVDYIQANSVTGIAISGVCDDFWRGIIDPNRSCFAYTTKWSGDMRLIDLSGFHNGHTLSALSGGDYVGTFDNTLGGQARAVSVSSDYAYIATSFSYSHIDGEYVLHPGGLLVVNWNSLNSETSRVDDYDPFLVGSYFYDTSDPNQNAALSDVYDISVSDDYAYLAYDDYGLVIVDVSSASHPSYVGRYNTTSVDSVAIHDNYAYITNSSGLQVIDVSNPSNPTYVDGYNTFYEIPCDADYNSTCTTGYPVKVTTASSGFPFFQKHYAYVITDSGELIIYEEPSSRWSTPLIILFFTSIVAGAITLRSKQKSQSENFTSTDYGRNEIIPEPTPQTTNLEKDSLQTSSPTSDNRKNTFENTLMCNICRSIEWHVSIHSQQYGPVDVNTLYQWISEGRITPENTIWNSSMPNWIPAAQTPLFSVVSQLNNSQYDTHSASFCILCGNEANLRDSKTQQQPSSIGKTIKSKSKKRVKKIIKKRVKKKTKKTKLNDEQDDTTH